MKTSRPNDLPLDIVHLREALINALDAGDDGILCACLDAAIKPGADLSDVGDRWVLWLLAGDDSPLAEWRADVNHSIPVAKLVDNVATLHAWRLMEDPRGSAGDAWEGIKSACSALPASDPDWDKHFQMMRVLCIGLFFCGNGNPLIAPSSIVKAWRVTQAALFAFEVCVCPVVNAADTMLKRLIFEIKAAANREA